MPKVDDIGMVTLTSPRGLSMDEAISRRDRGQGNDLQVDTSRSYMDIIRYNVLNLINIILFSIGAVMIAIGRTGDAVTSVGLIMMNVVIGVFQEVRAKRQLDQIALLSRPRITVLRDSTEHLLDPSELVLGDVIVVRAGDQIVVDGKLLGQSSIDVDESLLTGETDHVTKNFGDELLSGSFCVSGTAIYQATAVGADSYASKMTADARRFQVARTPLQQEVNFILRLLMLLAGFLGLLLLIAAVFSELPFLRQVQRAAVIAGLIPNGLFFMVIMAYALGSLRIVQSGALVQQANAVESLSNVTVLCTDKTGTLTANRINYHDVYPVGMDRAEVERLLGDVVLNTTATNKTSEAIMDALPGRTIPLADEVPFTSARKWSAVAFDTDQRRGVYVLGALEMLSDHLDPLDKAAADQMESWAEDGLRVLMFAYNSAVTTLHDATGNPTLPTLKPLGVVAFKDELRPHLQETLAEFAKNGIALKIISGDNPRTVAALARQAGLKGDLRYIAGPELAKLPEAEFKLAAAEMSIFGRITPDQKEALVDALQEQGHYVAMIGDGVNDVLSLKRADMGIAMESGSSATRAVADMILLGDSFGALPPAFTEGQRIVNGMRDILRLFLGRVLAAALLIIAGSIIGLGFPFVPKHNALVAFLTVGLPTIMLAVWARPGPTPRRGLLREVAHFVFPAAGFLFLFGLVVYILTFYLSAIELFSIEITPEAIESFRRYAGITYEVAGEEAYIFEMATLAGQSALATFMVLAGLLLVVFVEPPTRWFVGGDKYSGDWRPTVLAIGLLGAFVGIMTYEPLRTFFELLLLPAYAYVLIAIITLAWMFVLRTAWRRRWMQRFLEVDF
jgi:cation-transporting ATPase E